MKILSIVILTLFVTGCIGTNSYVYPTPFYLCESTESLLICEDEDLLECQGFLLEDKLIDLEEIEL